MLRASWRWDFLWLEAPWGHWLRGCPLETLCFQPGKGSYLKRIQVFSCLVPAPHLPNTRSDADAGNTSVNLLWWFLALPPAFWSFTSPLRPLPSTLEAASPPSLTVPDTPAGGRPGTFSRGVCPQRAEPQSPGLVAQSALPFCWCPSLRQAPFWDSKWDVDPTGTTDTMKSPQRSYTGCRPANPSREQDQCLRGQPPHLLLPLSSLLNCKLFKSWEYINTFPDIQASLIAQSVKNPPAVQETPVRFLGQEDPLEKG